MRERAMERSRCCSRRRLEQAGDGEERSMACWLDDGDGDDEGTR